MRFDHNNFLVKPRSWESIDRDANLLRRTYGFHDKDYFPVIQFLEHILCNEAEAIDLDIIEDKDALEFEGCTSLDGKIIFLRNSVYKGAYKNQVRHRFTVAHEIGHAILHAGQTPTMALMSKHPDKPFCQSEPQANRFAASLLAPFDRFNPYDNGASIAQRFGVSRNTAEIRIREYRKKILGESEFDF